MDKGYEKEGFESLSIKSSVVKKFRTYCKTMSESQSMALLHMIMFFENNGISPHEELRETIASLKGQMGKRFNAVIAIIKNIEKSQTKPTNAMMNLLFKEAEQEEGEEQVLLEDILTHDVPKQQFTETVELNYYREQYFTTKGDLSDLKAHLENLVNNTVYVRSNFGAGYYRLNITKKTFETLKQTLNHVHHDNTTETRR